MSAMVERVARAIAVADGRYPESAPRFMEHARAAIAAMREPTQAMITATADYSLIHARHDASGVLDLAPVAPLLWRAMIDAALVETPEVPKA